MSAKGYWLAFAIGVAAGAGVALLYAPQTGKSARKKLKNSLEDVLKINLEKRRPLGDAACDECLGQRVLDETLQRAA